MPNHEPNQGYGPFEAFSIKPNGEYLRTFHRTVKQAYRRLNGNSRHDGHQMIDHRPVEAGKRVWIWLDKHGQIASRAPKGGDA